MTHRLEDSTRTIRWSVSAEVHVGYHDCDICGLEIPAPSEAQLRDWAKEHGSGYMWPGEGEREWMPEGWSWHEPYGLICDDCTNASKEALRARRTGC